MKRDIKFVIFYLVAIQLWFINCVNADAEEDSWMDADAWARDHLGTNAFHTAIGKCCKCSDDITISGNSEVPLKEQQQTIGEDAASIIYFKKFITMLFNRKHFKYDSTLQVYERSVVFTVESSQLDKLEQLQDPRDLDNILADIFNKVRAPNMFSDGHKQLHTTEASSGFIKIVFEIFYDMLHLTKTSEVRFLLVVVIVILIAWILNNRFNIGWLSLIFGGIFIYGYLHTYLECNRELEVNQMLEILNRDKGSDKVIKESRIVKFLKGIFSSDDPQDLQQQKLKQSAKLSLGFCRPDHVLIMYFNDIFLKYLQVLLEQCTITLTSFNGALGFPYNILSGILLVCIIGYILKLTFKYILSPSAWAHLMHRNQTYQPEQAAIKSRTNSQSDRISGDNLKLLLNAINAAPQRNTASLAAVSGVEDLKEAIEPPPSKNISPTLDKCKDSRKQNNNNSNEKPLNENTNVTVEDLPDDS
ncbi:uncharacterized protein LOC119615989 [Lucilia sericata]|uniref:uncharacterized protein LOC119615989 n=1 Tax=Lucilia sericata TaxID=13632 RepID=UPI0018A8006D|nr:uncharacterized protein LOC119615989 [Lucilia sericata]